MEFREHTLANGLEVVAECNPQAHSCGFCFFVKTGSRDETPEVSGVSHFLEHMVFKGTATRNVEDVNREFDEMGADYNAGTGEEATDYHSFLLPEHLRWGIELWADVLQPALRTEDFDLEKHVILEEIQESLDLPPYGADDICKERFFGKHPLAGSILGTPQSIEGVTVEQMRTYFDEHYSAGNIALVGTGQIDFDHFVNCAEEFCGHWRPGKAPRKIGRPEFLTGLEVIEKPASTQEYVIQMAAGPSAQDDARFAANLLCVILGSHTGSRLYWELIDTGAAESVSVSHSDYLDCGYFGTFLSCDPERTWANLEVIQREFGKVQRDGITQEELDQARNKLAARRVLAAERPRGRLFTVANDWTYRQTYHTVKEELERYHAVTVDEIHRLLEQYPLSESQTVAVGPLSRMPAAE